MTDHHAHLRHGVRPLVACLLAAGSAAALAQEATGDGWLARDTWRTRPEVLAELDQARRDGSIAATAATYDFVGRSRSTRSRADVRDEALAARADGELARLNAQAREPAPPAHRMPAGRVLASTVR